MATMNAAFEPVSGPSLHVSLVFRECLLKDVNNVRHTHTPSTQRRNIDGHSLPILIVKSLPLVFQNGNVKFLFLLSSLLSSL